MARAGRMAVEELGRLLKDKQNGIGAVCGELITAERLSLPVIEPDEVLELQVAAEIQERGAGAKYPSIHLYCEKLQNSLREKFRTFSGKAELTIEIRVSHDRLEEMGRQTAIYVEAVTNILDMRRGSWGNGMFYAGGYEVTFGPVKKGGRNYIQATRVSIQVNISID